MGKNLVSVAVMAYNQEDEVKKALDSILKQKCNFEIEIVTGVDLSSDNTNRVIQSYIETAPDFVHYVPIFHESHVGEQANIVSILRKCTGKYIAF
jgi:glycosyltransferase involved in cell wall biosynthesis